MNVEDWLAEYLRLRIAHDWREILGLETDILSRIRVVVWGLDTRRGCYIRHASDPPTNDDALDDPWQLVEGAGHIDLAWRAGQPLMMGSLLHSSRSIGLVSEVQIGCSETFVVPLTPPGSVLPTIAMVHVGRDETSPSERSGPDYAVSQVMLDCLARFTRRLEPLIVTLLLRKLDTKRVGILERPASSDPGVVLSSLAQAIVNANRTKHFLGVGLTGYISVLPDGRVQQSRPFVHEGWLVSRRAQVLRRGVFEASTVAGITARSTTPAPAGASESTVRVRYTDPLRAGRFPLDDTVAGSFSAYEGCTAEVSVEIFDIHRQLCALLKIHRATTPDWLDQHFRDAQQIIERAGLDSLRDVLAALLTIEDAGLITVGGDLAIEVARRTLAMISADPEQQQRGQAGIDRVAKHLEALQVGPVQAKIIRTALRKLEICAEKLRDAIHLLDAHLTTMWLPGAGYRLAALCESQACDDIRIYVPGSGGFVIANRDLLADDLGYEAVALRRHVHGLARLLKRLDADLTERSQVVLSVLPVPPGADDPRDGGFVWVRLPDGFFHIFNARERAPDPQGRIARFPYRSIGFLASEPANRRSTERVVVLSELTANQLEPILVELVGAAHHFAPEIPHPEQRHLVVRWHRLSNVLELAAAVPVFKGAVQAHEGWVATQCGATDPLQLIGRGLPRQPVVVELARVRKHARLTPEFVALADAILQGREPNAYDFGTPGRDYVSSLLRDLGEQTLLGLPAEVLLAEVEPYIRILLEIVRGVGAARQSAIFGDLRLRARANSYGAQALARAVYIVPISGRSGLAGVLMVFGTSIADPSVVSGMPRRPLARDTLDRIWVDKLIAEHATHLHLPASTPVPTQSEQMTQSGAAKILELHRFGGVVFLGHTFKLQPKEYRVLQYLAISARQSTNTEDAWVETDRLTSKECGDVVHNVSSIRRKLRTALTNDAQYRQLRSALKRTDDTSMNRSRLNSDDPKKLMLEVLAHGADLSTHPGSKANLVYRIRLPPDEIDVDTIARLT